MTEALEDALAFSSNFKVKQHVQGSCLRNPLVDKVPCKNLRWPKFYCHGYANCLHLCEQLGADKYGYPYCGGFTINDQTSKGHLLIPHASNERNSPV